MKIRNFFPFLLLLSLFLSCDKMPTNGDLDGKWMLEHSFVRSAPDASFDVHADRRSESISWNFQLDLLSIRSDANHNGETAESIARFAVSGDRLDITKTYIHYRDRDVELTDPNTICLESVGIRGNADSYRIVTLSSGHLILCSDTDSLIFAKK
ncbi:MAG: lipocalin-like domain-containing protein [Alloprevotella sp.]